MGFPCERDGFPQCPGKLSSPFLLVKWPQGPPPVQDGELDCMVMRTEAAGQWKVAFALVCSRLAFRLQEAWEVSALLDLVRVTLGQVQGVGHWVHGRADAGGPAFIL